MTDMMTKTNIIGQEHDVCPICQDEDEKDALVRLPNCGHWIHMKCALQYALYAGYTGANALLGDDPSHASMDMALNLLCPVCRSEQVAYRRPRQHFVRSRDASGSSSYDDGTGSTHNNGNRSIIIVADPGSYDHLFLESTSGTASTAGSQRIRAYLWNAMVVTSVGVLILTCINAIQTFIFRDDDFIP